MDSTLRCYRSLSSCNSNRCNLPERVRIIKPDAKTDLLIRPIRQRGDHRIAI